MADVADAVRPAPVSGAPFGLLISDLRVEATYVEILDESVQRAIESLFNKTNSIEVEGRTLTARLEMPVISYAHSSYVLPGASSNSILRIPSNSPSVRGLMLVVRPAGGVEFGSSAAPRWRQIRVSVGGLCIQESPAREHNAENPDTLGSWLATETFRAAHLFSQYPPDEDAIKPDTAMARLLYAKQNRIQNAGPSDGVAPSQYDSPSIIHMSFENAPHYSLDGSELSMARGIDLRNIGEIRLELEYTDSGAADGVVDPLAAGVTVDVLLAHDEVYAVDRSGATNITQFVF